MQPAVPNIKFTIHMVIAINIQTAELIWDNDVIPVKPNQYICLSLEKLKGGYFQKYIYPLVLGKHKAL